MPDWTAILEAKVGIFATCVVKNPNKHYTNTKHQIFLSLWVRMLSIVLQKTQFLHAICA